MTARAAAILFAVAAVAGCGRDRSAPPRAALHAFLAHLAAGDVAATCRTLTAAAVNELARDFGGSGCAQTTGAVVRYLRSDPEQRTAVEGARILRQGDVPLSPAPTRAGFDVTRLRVTIRDPVLDRPQELDVTLRRHAERWRVDAGIAALFILLEAPGG